MSKSLLRTDKEIAEIYKRHSKTVYRVCFAYMKNPADTEDAVQDACDFHAGISFIIIQIDHGLILFGEFHNHLENIICFDIF